ncbi:N-acetylmuramidase family protein [Geomonas sp. Red69]|uniref:N-acetylmuramidase family protein n=1 Tax=Geomonas diazotrophica TaxID=2843197 RepID=UPI001C11674E|nr:N-acetylmuramidase family protein [Geomonas diazotrophica]MBU5638522.1 N-acetylmuramidase family protein [Geomonas diazotrophica]
MAGSRQFHSRRDPFQRPSLTPGPLGHNDAASPDTPRSFVGDTPGPLGHKDFASPTCVVVADPGNSNQIAKIMERIPGATKRLDETDFIDAANSLNLKDSVAIIKAFAEVECGGHKGFGPDGRPILAFEGHVFRRLTKRKHDLSHPLLSYQYRVKAGPQWKKNNRDHATAWFTLRQALALDFDAALHSCSWGMFQIMGFNYRSCGFSRVVDFVKAMKSGERQQLLAFIEFCKARGELIAAIAAKNFKKMALIYNGEDYGNYDTLIQNAYRQYAAK